MRLLLGTLITCVFASTPVLSEDVYQCQDRRSGAVYWNKFQLEGGRVFPLDLRAFVMKVISDTKRDVIGPGSTKHLTCRTKLTTTIHYSFAMCTTTNWASAEVCVLRKGFETIDCGFHAANAPSCCCSALTCAGVI